MDARQLSDSSSDNKATHPSAANPHAHAATSTVSTDADTSLDAASFKKRKGVDGTSISVKEEPSSLSPATGSSIKEEPSSSSPATVKSLGRGRHGVPSLLHCVVTAAGDNPILAALGGTPRSSSASISDLPEPEPLDLNSTTATHISMKTEENVAAPLDVSHAVGSKRKRTGEEVTIKKQEFVAYAREHIHNQEAGDEGFSIDPSDRAVEHRANKLVRREILIASPAANDDEEWEGSTQESMLEHSEEDFKPAEHFDMQPVDMILHVFSFLVSSEDFVSMAQVSKRWRELTSRRSLCRALPSTLPDGSVNWLNFQNLGIKNKGTEGTCFKCHQRSTGKILAMKKARVFPKVMWVIPRVLFVKSVDADR